MVTSEIISAIRSGVSGIHIQACDHQRVDEEIQSISESLNFKILEWGLGYGWVDFQNKQPSSLNKEVSLYENLQRLADDNPEQKLYVIRNAYPALHHDIRAVARLQHELLRIKRYFSGKSAILLISKEGIDFPEIASLLVPYSFAPLSSADVDALFGSFLEKSKISVGTEIKNAIISTCSGMERDIAIRVFRFLKNKYGDTFPKAAVEDVLVLKKKVLSESGLLELVDSRICIENVGGLGHLKNWLRKKKRIIDDLKGAETLGIVAPRGVLLVGMPGCGKSMTAKATASLFKVPLLRLEIGSLMGKYVGESEANMKAALKVAEKASPCVLWIDELEKAFSGVNGSGGSAEITTRLFGYFLTWMQEKPGAVFVVATANDITSIPPELLRRGRFDEIFYIDLPNQRERELIFKALMNKLPQRQSTLDFEALARQTDKFSGADIEFVINDSLEDVFRRKESNLTTPDLEKTIQSVTPIGVALENKIGIYREKFEEFKLKSASLSEDEIKKVECGCDSKDSSERENAAASEFLPPDRFVKLIKDKNPSVRKAALKNPNCSSDALKQITSAYKRFDFGKSGVWHGGEITEDEFNLALQHQNMNGEQLFDLYQGGAIDEKKLLTCAHKLSKNDWNSVFKDIPIKLSRTIKKGVIRKVRVSCGDFVKESDIILEIDDESGNTRSVSASVAGRVSELCVQYGVSIVAGDVLAKITVPKNKTL
jgi:AAA+ superfamily predicted ATPase